MAATALRRIFAAPRAEVFAALTDPARVAIWRVPDGMTAEIHRFEAWPGGRFRLSLHYDRDEGQGKSASGTDTYAGRFAEVVPGRRLVEILAFETADPGMEGEMTITTELADVPGGTEVTATHAGLPPGLSPELNALGWAMAMDSLALLLERRDATGA